MDPDFEDACRVDCDRRIVSAVDRRCRDAAAGQPRVATVRTVEQCSRWSAGVPDAEAEPGRHDHAFVHNLSKSVVVENGSANLGIAARAAKLIQHDVGSRLRRGVDEIIDDLLDCRKPIVVPCPRVVGQHVAPARGFTNHRHFDLVGHV